MIVIFKEDCSKCVGLASLLEHYDWTPVNYLNGELTEAILDQLFANFEGPLADLIRINDTAWQETGLDANSISDADLKVAIMEAPEMLQRPIVLNGSSVLVARPPERIYEIIDRSGERSPG